MNTDDEEVATVTLTSEHGSAVFSCVFAKDPEFLNHNRMSLVGVRQDWIEFLKVRGGFVNWSVNNDPHWFTSRGSTRMLQKTGKAFVRSSGMARGVSINETTIQKFAELEILECVEQTSWPSKVESAVSNEYFFLQRPRYWNAFSRRTGKLNGLRCHGEWHSVRDLKFRLLSVGYLRDDRRLSSEVELLRLPGVEIRPRREMRTESFDEEADLLWFCLRILVSFRCRQLTVPLVVNRNRIGDISKTWSTVGVEPRRSKSDFEELPTRGVPSKFFSRAAAALLDLKSQHQLLHAAAFGYANSFEQVLPENRLTSCVEAIERLVGAFESAKGLQREVLARKEWRRVSAALRGAVDGHGLDAARTGRLKRSFAMPAMLTLQDRIERMIHHYRRRWSESDRKIALGLGDMIRARNDIVHGRMIEDHHSLHTEVLRARIIFERLFLGFLRSDGFGDSGHARWIVQSYDRSLADRSVDLD